MLDGTQYLRHDKDALQSPDIVPGGTAAECWSAIHDTPLRYSTTLPKIFLSILRSSGKNQISISVITIDSAEHDYARWSSRYPKAESALNRKLPFVFEVDTPRVEGWSGRSLKVAILSG